MPGKPISKTSDMEENLRSFTCHENSSLFCRIIKEFKGKQPGSHQMPGYLALDLDPNWLHNYVVKSYLALLGLIYDIKAFVCHHVSLCLDKQQLKKETEWNEYIIIQ